MKSKSLEDIDNELEAEQKESESVQGEIITKQQTEEDDKKYKEALTQGYNLMGMFCGGIEKLWPYVGFGKDEKEAQLFFDTGAIKIADVLKKYDTPDAPEWYKRWKEEIAAARFFGMAGVSVYIQVQEHKKALEKEEKKNKGDNENEK